MNEHHQTKNPLHGVTPERMLADLVEHTET